MAKRNFHPVVKIERETEGRDNCYIGYVYGVELPQRFDRQFDAEQAANVEMHRLLTRKAA